MAERENKKKLSKEELHAENQKIKSDISKRNATTREDSERIVNSLRPKNLLFYAIVLLIPVVGVPLIWLKQKDLKINNASVYLWTGIGIIVLIRHIQTAINMFG